jgi:6,7-dimethyl-8-ribityllumazine synthase
VTVPGALEIPGAIAFAEEGGHRPAGKHYDGYVALGCVIRGETYHFEIVSNESARGIMDLTIGKKLCIGNGVLTTEDDEQAWARARISEGDKGGGAARAALTMIDLKRQQFWARKPMSAHASRSVARLAAVQALYQMEVSGPSASRR